VHADSTLSRREWLKACSVLALGATGCARLQFAERVLSEPHPDDWRTVLTGLVQAFVAFDDPQFPPDIAPLQVETQLLSLFPLAEQEQFSSMRRGLMAFNELALFASHQAALADDERTRGTAEADIDAAFAYESRALGETRLSGRFLALGPGERRAYLRLWGRSPFQQRRQFYRGTKTLIMIATYSLVPLWQSIGYDGPVLRNSPLGAQAKTEG
jgi:hypothetical protein